MTKSERRDYWRRFLQHLRSERLLRTEREPYDEYWQIIDDWSRHKIRLSARLNSESNWIHIDLTFSGERRYEHFDRVQQECGTIPRNLLSGISERAEKWERDHPEHPGECWIYLRTSADPMDSHARDEQHQWLAHALVIFRQVFGDHIDDW